MHHQLNDSTLDLRQVPPRYTDSVVATLGATEVRSAARHWSFAYADMIQVSRSLSKLLYCPVKVSFLDKHMSDASPGAWLSCRHIFLLRAPRILVFL